MILENFQRHPFLRLLMPLVVGILCGDAFPHTLSLWGCLVSSLLLLTFFIVCYRCYFKWWYGVGVNFFFLSLGFSLVSQRSEQTDYAFADTASTYKVCIQDEPEIKERSILCRAVLVGEFTRDTILPAFGDHSFLLYFPKDSIAGTLRRGDGLLIHTRLMPPANNGNPDEFDYVRYLKHKGVTGISYVIAGHWRVIEHDTSRTFRQTALDCRKKVVALYRNLGLKGDELAVLSALTVGDKEELSDDIVETYSVAGASHVLALSGLHIGFIYTLLYFVFAFLWDRWEYLKPFLLLVIILFLWSFAFLTGLSTSVVRSVVMFSLLALSHLQLEKPLSLNILSATAFLMLLYSPFWLFDVGFQLSFAAVAAILVIQPKLYALWKAKNCLLRYGWGLITVSIAAQIGVAPLIVFYFSRFSTHFLLTNLWVIPMTSLIIYSAVLLLALTPFPFLQYTFSAVVKSLVHIQNAVLQWIEHLPLASLDGIWVDLWEVLLYYLLLGSIGYTFRKRSARSVYFSLFVMLMIVSCHLVSNIFYAPRKSILFYNVRGCPAVHCMTESTESWLVCADSLPDVSRLHRSLTPYWNHLHLEQPKLITGDYSTDCLSIQNQILCYAGKRICFLHDARWKDKLSVHPVSIDYLYISRGYKEGMKELSSLFSIGTVVLDASLPVYYREKIINECIHLGISYLSLSEKGSVRILL